MVSTRFNKSHYTEHTLWSSNFSFQGEKIKGEKNLVTTVNFNNERLKITLLASIRDNE